MFLTIIIFLSLIGVITAIVGFSEDGNFLIITVVCGLAMWLTIEEFDYGKDLPVLIPQSELEIVVFDDVAIIRHHGETYEYTSVREYKAIKEGMFVFVYIQNYNVQHETNGRDYELFVESKTLKEMVCE